MSEGNIIPGGRFDPKKKESANPVVPFRIPCTNCGATISILIDTSNELYLLKCSSCKKGVAMTSSSILSVSSEFLNRIASRYPLEQCGVVQDVDTSDRYSLFIDKSGSKKNKVSPEYIKKLREALDSSESAEEIFKKIDGL